MTFSTPMGIAGNQSGTVRVRVTADGALDDIHLDRSEFRYGGTALAQTIMQLYGKALSSAGAARRAEFARHGVSEDILARVVP